MPPQPRRPLARWQSLNRRLPLVLSVFLVLGVGGMAVGAFRAVRGVLLEATRARLELAAREVATLLAQGLEARRSELAALAAEPAVVELATGADSASAAGAAAHRLLEELEAEPQAGGSEIWSRQGRLLLAVPGAALPQATPRAAPPAAAGPSTLVAEQGGVSYDLTVPIGGGDAPAGWLRSRRVLSSGRGAAVIASLIGPDTRLLLGNLDGSSWTDLDRQLPPPAALGASGGASAGVVGLALPVPSSPWQLWLEVPTTVALAPLRPFLRQLLWLAFGVVVLGAVAARLVSGRITGPIERLTAAAEGVARGELDLPVPRDRLDEVGRLGSAFDSMREQVAAAHQQLEDKVAERTRELRDALSRLEEAQAALVRAEKLATLGQLASGVGHELRNPLAVMTNALFYLEMVLEDQPEEVREYLGILRHEIGLSEKIVGDLLDFARVKPPQRQAVDLAALVEEQVHRLGRSPGVEVDLQLDASLPAVRADRVQIGQIVFNLLVNATQAMGSAGGTLTLSGHANGHGSVVLVVSDQGPGVPTELRERIFEPLFTTKARGIGLGLAVSRRLAEVNEGELRLADAASGAAFALELPAAERPPA